MIMLFDSAVIVLHMPPMGCRDEMNGCLELQSKECIQHICWA